MTDQEKSLSQQLTDQYDDIVLAGAFKTLMDYAAEPVQHFVMAHAPHEYVEDICADTWAIMWGQVRTGIYQDRGADPIGYVIGIARNVALRYGVQQQRAQQREVGLDDADDPMAEDGLMNIESQIDVASLRQVLSDPDDLAVLQALLADQTITDMAANWQCHYKTAWRRYHRFLEHSREALGEAAIPAQFIAQRG